MNRGDSLWFGKTEVWKPGLKFLRENRKCCERVSLIGREVLFFLTELFQWNEAIRSWGGGARAEADAATGPESGFVLYREHKGSSLYLPERCRTSSPLPPGRQKFTPRHQVYYGNNLRSTQAWLNGYRYRFLMYIFYFLISVCRDTW